MQLSSAYPSSATVDEPTLKSSLIACLKMDTSGIYSGLNGPLTNTIRLLEMLYAILYHKAGPFSFFEKNDV